MPVSVAMNPSLPPLAPSSGGARLAALRSPDRPLVGAVHLRRVALVLAGLALACLGAATSDRSTRPNGPLAWHASPLARAVTR